jgi:hypothetical protein
MRNPSQNARQNVSKLDSNTTADTTAARKPYQRPRLVEFGNVRDFTHGPTGSTGDSPGAGFNPFG